MPFTTTVLVVLAGAAFLFAVRGLLTPRDVALEPGEASRHAGPANHFVGVEGVGGKLVLTDRRVVFRSHGFNIQVHALELPLASIASVTPVMTLGLVDNGLLFRMTDGHVERFVVGGRQEWLAAFSAAGIVAGSGA